MVTFETLNQNVINWSKDRKIIPNSSAAAQFKKLKEEVKELGDGIEANDMAEIVDGIGDSLVVLINIAALLDLEIVECLGSAYLEIKDRRGYMNEEGIFIKEVA